MNARGNSIDNTYLSIDTVENRFLIHRDYIAHCFRWSHAAKVAARMRGDLWVLDIGCGREMPLAKLLYTNKIGAQKYCGVEYSVMKVPDMLRGNGVFPIRLLKGFDAAKIDESHVSFRPNLVTMFEVFEHVEPEHGRRILDNVKRLLRPDGTFLFSTPCFNGSAAGNHVAEPEYEIMGASLEDAGFAILDHWGTFASIRDYVHDLEKLGPAVVNVFNTLRSYYDVNTLAVIFAPMFPEFARNCIWELVHPEYYKCLTGKSYERQFPTRLEVKPRYSATGSSSKEDDILDESLLNVQVVKRAPTIERPSTSVSLTELLKTDDETAANYLRLPSDMDIIQKMLHKNWLNSDNQYVFHTIADGKYPDNFRYNGQYLVGIINPGGEPVILAN